MQMETIGRGLVVAGMVLLVLGALLWFGARLGLGSLPGDIKISKQGWSGSVPITTSILLSLILTVLLNVLWRVFNR